MFFTQWNETIPKKEASHSGSEFEPVYKLITDEDGYRNLTIVGKKDLYAEIQASKDSCDINLILERFARGDESALSRLQGVYGDFTEMPKTLAELQQRVLDAEVLFSQLPLEERAKFDYNPSVFFAAMGTAEFNAAIGLEPEVNPNPEVDPVPINPVPEVDPAPVTKGE